MALLKNVRGEYNYQFNWINERGITVGFNDVWALNKREAVKRAKARESKAGWRVYDQRVGNYVAVKEQVPGGNCFYHDGMYVDVKSMYKATAKQAREMDRLGWMMTC